MAIVKSQQNRRIESTMLQNPRRRRVHAVIFGAAVCLVTGEAFAAEQPKVDFARDIQPIFIKRCFECHGPDKQKSDLRLDRKADALRGGKSGKPLFLAGKSAESE